MKDDELQAIANDMVSMTTENDLRIEALEARFAKMEAMLGVVQEEFLAHAHAKGFVGTETDLYKLIVALRKGCIA